MMDANGLDMLTGSDAILFGAVGHPDIQDHITLNGLPSAHAPRVRPVRLQRPSVLLPGVTSPCAI